MNMCPRTHTHTHTHTRTHLLCFADEFDAQCMRGIAETILEHRRVKGATNNKCVRSICYASRNHVQRLLPLSPLISRLIILDDKNQRRSSSAFLHAQLNLLACMERLFKAGSFAGDSSTYLAQLLYTIIGHGGLEVRCCFVFVAVAAGGQALPPNPSRTHTHARTHTHTHIHTHTRTHTHAHTHAHTLSVIHSCFSPPRFSSFASSPHHPPTACALAHQHEVVLKWLKRASGLTDLDEDVFVSLRSLLAPFRDWLTSSLDSSSDEEEDDDCGDDEGDEVGDAKGAAVRHDAATRRTRHALRTQLAHNQQQQQQQYTTPQGDQQQPNAEAGPRLS